MSKELEALEIIKKHILNRGVDSSGVYVELVRGRYENCYLIQTKEGTNLILTEEEYNLLEEVLTNAS